jgi:signal peptidase I
MTAISKLILQVLFFPFAIFIKAFKSKRNILLRIIAIFISIFALLPAWALAILILVLVVVNNTGLPSSPFDITGNSMLPTLTDSRILWTYPVKSWFNTYKPKRGDIVVFKDSKSLHNGQEVDFIKRIIAISGDDLEIKNGNVYLNGQSLD